MCKDRCRRSSRRSRAATAGPRPRRREGNVPRSETRGDEEFVGLRPYAPGVPLKHMAWKVLARGGEAAVRGYTGLAAQPEWLEWSALEGLGTEARLSQLCRWVLANEAGYRRAYGLRIPGVEISPGWGAAHRARCLRALALHQAEPASPSEPRRMKLAAAAETKVTYDQLKWLCACLALALIAHLAALPYWLIVTVCAAAAIRLGLAARGRAAPARGIRLCVAAVSIALLFVQYRTFNGLAAGTALLSLLAGLKLLELQSHRDFHVIILIIYFLNLAALLHSESFWLLGYLIAVSWLTSAALMRLTISTPPPRWQPSVRRAGRVLAQALPLTLILWLFFPRLDGPLWRMPQDSQGGESGLSDSMSPGDISDLAQSDDIAFRVHYINATPPPLQRYYRGPVLHDFDGHTWRRTRSDPTPVPLAGARGKRVSIHLERGAAPAQLVIRARLAGTLGPAGRSSHERLHAGTARSRITPRRDTRRLVYPDAHVGCIECGDAPARYTPPVRPQSAKHPLIAAAAQHAPGRHGLRPRGTRTVS